jgi:hypothetical protein
MTLHQDILGVWCVSAWRWPSWRAGAVPCSTWRATTQAPVRGPAGLPKVVVQPLRVAPRRAA